ncbi:RNA-binding domain-containing protein [Coprinopsis marcescibilis]|uniref:RNA-binding domain-containing protein n=1 Tax=Coprinopsis marcescibilis TaxID=230819 RepID=A0A5C3L6I9_COPMA|nr:RNA-binding domain-containing protein [Coprinopsis marcescibilis]
MPCLHFSKAPNPSSVLGVFGLSIRTRERDLDDEFSRFGRVENVTIVYDQRQSDRSRGFGFIRMSTTEEATRCIQELNGVELNGRRIRVDYSVTDRPHAPTPGEYMGHRRQQRERDSSYRDRGDRGDRGDRYDRDRDSHRDRDRRRDDRGGSDKDRDPYGRDRDWRDRRSPAPRTRQSPEYRRRRSYSRSPARSPPPRSRDFDAAAPNGNGNGDASRW